MLMPNLCVGVVYKNKKRSSVQLLLFVFNLVIQIEC